jgi:molecular chaperone DnaK
VQALVKKLTGDKEPNMSVNPDEVVALGAAVQAAIIKGEMADVLLLDVTPLSLGVETLGGIMTRIIERNTTIPARRTEVFSTAEDKQSAVDVVVLQGEREMAQDNRQLGRFRLEGIRAAARGIPQIEVTFDIDANGILNVSARDKDTGTEQKVTISGSTNLDKQEVERMLREATAHATADRSRRQEIELRNRADALTYQVEQTLQDLGERVPYHEKARAEQLIAQMRTALKEQAPTDQLRTLVGELEQLLHMFTATTRQTNGAATNGQSATAHDHVVDAEFTEKK